MNFKISELEGAITEVLNSIGMPGMAVSVTSGNESIYKKVFGYRDVANKIPADENTVYAIASLTKAMTAVCCGMLVDEGKLSWDEPIISYLPEFRMHDDYAGRNVCLRDMLAHNTGLPRHDWVWYNTELSRSTEDLVHRIRYLPLNKPMRTLYEYNNLMYATAGLVIERVTGQTWAEFIKERLFKPLGMDNSSPVIKGLSEAENRALPYNKNSKYPEEAHTTTNYLDFDGMGACGTVNSTINDMTKWVQLNLNKGMFGGVQIVSEKTMKTIHTPVAVQRAFSPIPEIPMLSYALGWGVRTYRGNLNITHSGGIDGFSTYISMLPDKNVGIAILTNLSQGNYMHFVAANMIKDFMLGSETKDWIKYFKDMNDSGEEETKKANKSILEASTQVSPPDFKSLVGEYTHKGYGTAYVSLEENLQVKFNGLSRKLSHSNHDTFYFDMSDGANEDLRITQFKRNPLGKVTGVLIDAEKALNGEFILFEKPV